MDFTRDDSKTHYGFWVVARRDGPRLCSAARRNLALDILKYYAFFAQLLELPAIS
jgi:hypothetical protein